MPGKVKGTMSHGNAVVPIPGVLQPPQKKRAANPQISGKIQIIVTIIITDLDILSQICYIMVTDRPVGRISWKEPVNHGCREQEP
jgi:hypothetical protein